ncbi:kinase-like domain-containing protein [Mariannaea sp. PMI_226]|nr:kinase-like domain-containing protein [Mariannaea sp. PMI_226]
MGSVWHITDWDQRRVISVMTSWEEDDEDFILEALMLHIDEIPADALLIEIAQNGELVNTTTDGEYDSGMILYYPSIKDYGHNVPYIYRQDLIELNRLGLQVDLTILRSNLGNNSRRIVFKYYINKGNIAAIWHEANCLMRIPEHPNIVPFDQLVVDTLDGDNKVVGYITPFVPGGTILDNRSRPFKLKHLRQLINAVDYLNLKLGIIHGDICVHNLLINPKTNSVQLFDFNIASKLRWEGDDRGGDAFEYNPDRNNIKNTIFTLYEIITRDAHFREENHPYEIDPSMVMDLSTWEKHLDVHLDADIAEYRQVLQEWVSTRKDVDTEITLWTQAPRCLDWPLLPQFPEVMWVGAMTSIDYQFRQEMLRIGADFLKWQRPASCELPLPEGQLLLASGQVIDSTTGKIVARPEIAGLRYAIKRPN